MNISIDIGHGVTALTLKSISLDVGERNDRYPPHHGPQRNIGVA